MFAKGPQGGYSPKQDTLVHLPTAQCIKLTYSGCSWFEVRYQGKTIGQHASSVEAWKQAHLWAESLTENP